MAAIIFSIGNNTCNLLSDHHFKSYLETINHSEREINRQRETERQRDRETERQRERETARGRERETARDRERNHSKQFLQTTTG